MNVLTGYGPAVTDEPDIISNGKPDMHDKEMKRLARPKMYNEKRI